MCSTSASRSIGPSWASGNRGRLGEAREAVPTRHKAGIPLAGLALVHAAAAVRPFDPARTFLHPDDQGQGFGGRERLRLLPCGTRPCVTDQDRPKPILSRLRCPPAVGRFLVAAQPLGDRTPLASAHPRALQWTVIPPVAKFWNPTLEMLKGLQVAGVAVLKLPENPVVLWVIGAHRRSVYPRPPEMH